MKIAVYGQFYHVDTLYSMRELLKELSKEDVEVHIESHFFNLILSKDALKDYKHYKTFTRLDASYNLLISIGGDGTILRAITHINNLSIPIIGINTGRLGFLATIQVSDIKNAIAAILTKDYKISERTLLSVETKPTNSDLLTQHIALNEVTVSRKNTTSMISVETYLDHKHLTSYWADGLIIATPTGSTGYSLSCGGPVIIPESNSLVLTPIAPHNLNARPLVIPDQTTVQLKVSGREDQHLISLDSRITTLHNSTVITIKKAPFTIKMLELNNKNFTDTLRKKLLWGEDKRNKNS